MTKDNLPPSNPKNPNGPQNTPEPTPPKKKKRRLVLKIIGALVVLLILLVVLLPTIASMGFVREIVLKQVNNGVINGRVEIEDWAFGWTSGAHITGIRVFGDDNVKIVDVGQVDCPISLIKAATGNIDLGNTRITNPDLNIICYKDGQLNVLKLLKPSPPSNKPPGELPNVKGQLTVENATGSYTDQGMGFTSHFDANVAVKIPSINDPIEDQVQVSTTLDGKDFATITIDGTASAIRGNFVDADHLAVSQTISIKSVDLAPLSPVLVQIGKQQNVPQLNLAVAGKIGGDIKVDVDTLKNITAAVKLAIASPSAGGPGLNGDTVLYKNVTVAMNASMAGDAVKLDLPIAATPAGGAMDDKITVHVDSTQDTLLHTAAVAQAILNHLLNAKAPEQAADIPGKGIVTASVDVGVAQLLNQVPHMVPLNQGVTLNDGRLATTETITIGDDKAVVDAQTHITDFKGTNAGNNINLQNIDSSVGISAVGGQHPALRSPEVSLTSGFATFKGGGADLGKTAFDGSLDFDALQKQVAQVLNLDQLLHNPQGSHVAMTGTATLHIESSGDLTQKQTAVNFATNIKVDNLKISGLGKESIDLPSFATAVTGTADLDQTQPNPLQDVSNLKITANSPAIDFDIDAKAKMDGPLGVTVPAFAINKGTINLAELQKEFGGAVRFLANRTDLPQIQNGTVVLAGKGTFESTFSFDQPLSLHIDPADVSFPDSAGKMQTLHFEPLTLSLNGTGNVDAASKTTTVKDLSMRAVLGDAASPIFIAVLNTDAVVTDKEIDATSITLKRCEGDLPRLQKMIAPALKVFLPPALPTTQPTPIQQFADQTLQITGGSLTATMTAKATYQPKPLLETGGGGFSVSISSPLTAQLQNVTAVQNGKTVLDKDNITATVGADVVDKPTSLTADLNDLSLKINDAVDVELDPTQKFHATLAGADLSANGQINLTDLNLDKLILMGQPFLPVEQQEQLKKLAHAGTATGSVRLSKGADNSILVTLDVADNGVQTVNGPLDNLHVVASGSLSADHTVLSKGSVNIASTLGRTISIANVSLRLPGGSGPQPGIFDMLQNADINVDGLILTRLQLWASFLGQIDRSQVPVTLTAGELNLSAHVQRTGNTTIATLQSLDIKSLAFTKGTANDALPNDITIQAGASIDTAPNMPADAPLMAQIAKATVNSLAMNLGPIQVTVPSGKTIALSGLNDMQHLAAAGDIVVDGDIGQACSIMQVFTGTIFPYTGTFHFEEPFQKNAASAELLLTGGGKVSKFQVLNVAPTGGKLAPNTPAVAFSENEIDVLNPLRFNPADDSVLIHKDHPITIALKSTGAASISIVGGVHDMQVARKLEDGTAITLDYDLAKIWPIIKPMVPPDQLAKISDLELSGVEHKVITASGSYPADLPMNQAVRTFKAAGDLGVGHVATNGLAVDNMDVFFSLADGKFNLSTPKPAACNGGTIDLGTIVTDLTGDEPMASMPGVDPTHIHTILSNISLNAALAKSMLGKFLNNPVFTGADSAKGLVTLSVYRMQSVPLGNLLQTEGAKNPGLAEVKYSITGLQVGAPLLSQLPGFNASMTAEIKDGDVQLAQGKITEDSTMMINKTNPLRVWGVVGLQTKTFQPMTALIPIMLFGSLIPGNIRQYVPDQLVVPMVGDMNHPKFELDKTIAQAVQDAAKKAALQTITGGKPDQGGQNNPIGGLLNGLMKKK